MLQSVIPAPNEGIELACSSCHTPLDSYDAQYGHPFITARQLMSMAFATIIRSPKLFKEIMFTELPPAPYCATCRQQLPAKRQTEQFKIMIGFLLVLCAAAALLLLL